MVVRFVPADEPAAPRPDRQDTDLAEVIDFRSRLRPQNEWSDGSESEVRSESQPGVSAGAEASVSCNSKADVSKHEQRNIVSADSSLSALNVGKVTHLRAVQIDTHTQFSRERDESATGFANSASLGIVNAAETDASHDAPKHTAYEEGVTLLARKALSRGELSRDLMSRGHSSLDVEIVLDEFCDRLYLDDTSLARTLAERLRERKGASKGHIRQKLRERLLTDADISLVLEELDDAEEFALLREAASDRARKMTGLDRATAERRLMGFLARRGWSGEHVHRAIREALDENGNSRTVRFR